MKEYEVRDLGASMTSNIIDMAGMQGDYIAIYITVVFAFIAASYVAGREFNKVQTLLNIVDEPANQSDFGNALKISQISCTE